MISERSDTSTGVILEEFEIEEGATTLGKAGENVLPATLAFVAMCELDVRVLQCDWEVLA